MKANLRPFDRLVRLGLAALSFFYAAFIAHGVGLQLLALVFGGWCLGESVSSYCPYMAAIGVKNPKQMPSSAGLYLTALHLIQMVLAFEWGTAAWEKFSSPDFISGMSKTLEHFASANPYPWYAHFLTTYAVPSAAAFGQVVQWGEALVAVGLIVGVAVSVWVKDEQLINTALALTAGALIGGMLMNAAFYLAAGWTSPSTAGLNALMFWCEAALAYVKIQSLLANPQTEKEPG